MVSDFRERYDAIFEEANFAFNEADALVLNEGWMKFLKQKKQ
mgnify:FL=1